MNLKKILIGSQSGGIFLALILMCVLISSLTPRFLTDTNLLVILNQVSVNAILAFGVTFVIISGGIDLSLGSMLAVAGVVAALFAKSDGGNVYLALLMALGVGALMGAMNGFTVILSKVPPFIVTLGTMTIARGAALIISSGRPVSDLSESFNYLGNGDLVGIPIPILFLVGTYVVCHFVLTQTVFGRYVTAIGGNETAAWVAGIPVAKVKWWVYTLSGIFAALGGILLSARINTGQPNAGLGFELDAIAAVIIGGTSTRGGKGSMTGTLLGVLFIGVINNGLDLLNVSAYWQQVVMGGIIILAVVLDSVYQKMKR
ncbi:ABC transporter permease [Cytophagaceae bacterium 50C-KIRBA]|uniref:ABC transporter permease n=1 Tax=Aquirufa beregesia TaxID=2516556 RepID=A0ABX0EXH0_9BACT|nr:ABC transporter permease [Aquirufa beregesia]NGZ45294.1 ABC transporter permease [Aquirufa beregesia]